MTLITQVAWKHETAHFELFLGMIKLMLNATIDLEIDNQISSWFVLMILLIIYRNRWHSARRLPEKQEKEK